MSQRPLFGTNEFVDNAFYCQLVNKFESSNHVQGSRSKPNERYNPINYNAQTNCEWNAKEIGKKCGVFNLNNWVLIIYTQSVDNARLLCSALKVVVEIGTWDLSKTSYVCVSCSFLWFHPTAGHWDFQQSLSSVNIHHLLSKQWRSSRQRFLGRPLRRSKTKINIFIGSGNQYIYS